MSSRARPRLAMVLTSLALWGCDIPDEPTPGGDPLHDISLADDSDDERDTTGDDGAGAPGARGQDARDASGDTRAR